MTAQLHFHRLSAVALLAHNSMLSVDGSSGSASTNQTAAFGYSMSDTAEEAIALPARPGTMKNDLEGLGTPTPEERGSPVQHVDPGLLA